ncbi:thiamine phosphate synthase [Methylocapsa polymorpha]|uniref:Thiamine phosphate synthase n=1 Tax=Methylocapsa polymorpha TaxID=3080828 RepID=A0ABZ0HV53_9HYPH|nr:thiamine phosphate synthase [Methylocapsa sp. RX1]
MLLDMPRLYLITPPISDFAAFAPLFDAALAASDIACVLLRTEARDDGDRKKIIRALAPMAQAHGAACLIVNDPQLAVRADADGVHMEATGERLKAALSALQPNRIVGAGGLTTRDAAMTAGEAGVDYLMFGGPDCAEPHASIVERVAWWAEIFNVPSVGYAHDLEGAPDLVRAGADFIALGDAVFADPRGAPAALRDAAAIVARVGEPAQ